MNTDTATLTKPATTNTSTASDPSTKTIRIIKKTTVKHQPAAEEENFNTKQPDDAPKPGTVTGTPPVEDKKLSKAEKASLKSYEKTLEESHTTDESSFFKKAKAAAAIREDRLYRETHPTFEAYFADKWDYRRSHAKRLARTGDIIDRQIVAPTGAIVKLMNSESHYRMLAKLDDEKQDEVMARLASWIAWSESGKISARMVESAVLLVDPAIGPKAVGTRENPLVKQFVDAVDAAKKEVPKTADKDIKGILERLRKKAVALGNPARTTGIDWTDVTWNPLQGCARASSGCDNCYAAQLVATRLAHVYPGLASEVEKDGKKTFIFNNIIRLLPEHLGDPLRDLTPRRYFVNSMSDLFHQKVPEEFITAVFDVMVKAHWHQFQVLTKRPERMAEFTIKYFAGKEPPQNIWLGTSTENQKTLDERLPHLLKVVAAVRWLSLEPLIGPIEFDNLDDVDWVVLGGESGKGARKMELAWATTVRDACKKAEVPFFFKQWGLYGPDGKKLKKAKKDGLTPPPLEGKIHDDYPQPRVAAPETAVDAVADKPASVPTPEPATPADGTEKPTLVPTSTTSEMK